MTDYADRVPAPRPDETGKHPRKATPPPGGWPTGGTQVAGWHLCAACGDSIYPGEHVYDNGGNTVRCAVCEIARRAATTTPTRPVPTLAARLTDARRCGHTPAQHRHDDGQAADARSQDRAIRELTAELAGARGKLRSVERERDRLARELDSTQQVATFRQGVIDQQAAELGAAQELIAVVDDLAEQLDRARARYATRPSEQPPAGLGSAPPRAQEDEQAARDRVEHAIRARLAVAWKTLPIDEVWLDQVAAVAAVAAVNELREG